MVHRKAWIGVSKEGVPIRGKQKIIELIKSKRIAETETISYSQLKYRIIAFNGSDYLICTKTQATKLGYEIVEKF